MSATSLSMRGRLAAVAAAVTVGVVAAAAPASAAVWFDPSCSLTASNAQGKCGFVGKGDVQLALGYNNTQMQKNQGNLKFTWSQASSQALTQSATQAGSQDGTQAGSQQGSQAGTQDVSQAFSEDLSCTVTVGSETNKKVFHRDGSRLGTQTGTREGTRIGTRTGDRTGTRTGDRTGNRTGTLSGAVSYTLAYDARQKTQVTGFFLTGATSNGFTADGSAPAWDAWSFGDYDFGAYQWGSYDFGDYDFGDYQWDAPDFGDNAIVWGDWESEPGENPASCAGGNPGVSDVNHQVVAGAVTPVEGSTVDGTITDLGITDGTVTDGQITDLAITPGEIQYGAVTPTGAAHLYVNGIALN